MGASASRKSFELAHAGQESERSSTKARSIKRRDPDSNSKADLSPSQAATVPVESASGRSGSPIAQGAPRTRDNSAVAMAIDEDADEKVTFCRSCFHASVFVLHTVARRTNESFMGCEVVLGDV